MSDNEAVRSSQRLARTSRAPTKVLAGFAPRRTPEEKKVADEASAAQRTIEAAQALANAEAVKKTISRLEDEAQRDEIQRRKAVIVIPARPSTTSKLSKTGQSSVRAAGHDSAKMTAAKVQTDHVRNGGFSATANGQSRRGVVKPVAVASDDDVLSDDDSDQDTSTAQIDHIAASSGYDDGDVSSEGGWAVPPMSTVDSDSDGVLLGGGGYESEDSAGGQKGDDDYTVEDDPDNEEDDDGEDEEMSEDDDEPKRKQSKPSKKRGTAAERASDYRAKVSEYRKTASKGPISVAVTNQLKRKGAPTTSSDVPLSKQPKKGGDEPAGLLGSYKAAKARERAKASASQSPDDVDEPFEYNGGAFDNDEDIMALSAARSGKKQGPGNGSKSTGVRIKQEDQVAHLALPRRRLQKTECTLANLPFPGTISSTLAREYWKKRFKSTLIAWNGALRQPFSSGTHLLQQVKVVWNKVYGDDSLDEDDMRWDIVEGVTGDFLLNWRSEIGKTALTVVVEMFQEELGDDINTEAASEAARHLLDDFRFVYGRPDAPANESALPFEGGLVVRTFAYHMKQVVFRLKGHKCGSAVGALALSAAAVERALCFIRDGCLDPNHLPPKPLDAPSKISNGKRAKSVFPPFSEATWGAQTRAFVETAEKLTGKQWDSVASAAMTKEIEAMMENLSDDEEGDGEKVGRGTREDGRAQLRM